MRQGTLEIVVNCVGADLIVTKSKRGRKRGRDRDREGKKVKRGRKKTLG
jgi:hypothetical protein